MAYPNDQGNPAAAIPVYITNPPMDGVAYPNDQGNPGGAIPVYTPGANARTIAQSAVPVTITGPGVETLLAQILIPAGTMGPNSSYDLLVLVSTNNNANQKLIRARIGSDSIWLANMSGNASMMYQQSMANRNALNSQVGNGQTTTASFNAGAGTVRTSTSDFFVDQTLQLLGTVATAGDTLTLERYRLVITN